ncbi:hypothetical protein MIND_01211800 [Mycena indigotica]|uniref:Uncharacterized protein n=1 Tax=Mycena indigotica TaxID=2126181 RepID=A0A8H6S5W3_9AGAR|nr:uncharacterized protein MIND_01211800 [Mycena indigotica]KAF7291865.1 hypothetical protein MIND_01211800 [Mycena indigotica]
MHSPSPQLHRQQRHRPQPSIENARDNLGMSPEARYEHNLKVLRRRDPSIISIFDQFTHVCVYHHNGEGWEKNGYEGSMFLYERDAYPPYGFYILNRMGKEDYVQRLHPEDKASPLGAYAMIRTFPEFTARRIAKINSQYDQNNLPDKFSPIYFPPDLDAVDKGPSQTVCLWMFPTDAREPMLDVMKRLQSYVSRNVPYPEQYRYGPGRPPPPNPHLRTSSPSPPPQQESNSITGQQQSAPPLSGSPSEIDKLFSKLTQQSSTKNATSVAMSPAQPRTKSMPIVPSVNGHTNGVPGPSHTPATGIALLDSIFASATPFKSPSVTKPQVHSPTPSIAPQVLNQDVITSLLGLPPSRVGSAVSHGSSREGDNEYEINGNLGSDGFSSSESSTVLDPEAEFDEELQAAGASAGRPLLSALATRAEARHATSSGPAPNGRVHGDVTPRPPLPRPLANGHTAVSPPMSNREGSHSTIRPAPPSSEPWTPVDDRLDSDIEDGEIVELDFADTSALSDPAAFREAQQRSRREHGVSPGPVIANGTGTRRGKGRKKGKRERAAERALENARLAQIIDPDRLGDGPSSRSVSASPDPMAAHVEMETPTASQAPLLPNLNSRLSVQSLFTGAPIKSATASPTSSPVRPIDPAIARASIISTVSVSAPAQSLPPRMERNEFVREVLTLIHTDSKFVDALWHDYLARSY